MGDRLESIRREAHVSLERSLYGGVREPDDYSQPLGDRGFFGPDSVTWQVHSDLPSMLIGGVGALLIQTLHPLAMAGVTDHSNFREDPKRRLAMTARFIAVTTYGGTPLAERAIRGVRKVHERVIGTAPDGRPYSANDPKLLTWVHTAEAASFLRGYQRYSGEPLSDRDCDRYLAEMSVIAARLGADQVPQSVAEVRAYYRAMQPELDAGQQARETVDFLMHDPTAEPADQLARSVLIRASIGILPGWAKRKLDLAHSTLAHRAVVTPAAKLISSLIRWIEGPSPLRRQALARSSGRSPDAPEPSGVPDAVPDLSPR